jgi:uncharacterized protein YjbI with pentapeptide repeats
MKPITSPQLPPLPAEPHPVPELTAGGHHRAQFWVGARFDAQHAEDVLIEQTVSRRGSWQHAELPLLQLIDCQFEDDDLAGVQLTKLYARRLVLVRCRLLGAAVIDADLSDVVVQHSKLDLCRCWNSKLAQARFEHCSLREASFDGSDLSGVRFLRCDLSGADLRNTKLRGADLRGSDLSGVQVSARELHGAIIDPQQAVGLIELFGVKVRPEA